jgi:hypothetical protein
MDHKALFPVLEMRFLFWIFYVAITRSRQILLLSSVSELPRDLAHRIGAQVRGGSPVHARTISSRFMAELGRSRPAAIRGRDLFS